MANKDLFKQAIAEAKAIREAAILNAKEALEETLTPHLKDMLAAKLQEMEDSDMDDEKLKEYSSPTQMSSSEYADFCRNNPNHSWCLSENMNPDLEEEMMEEGKEKSFSFNYNTDPDDVEYIQDLLDKAGIYAKAKAGIDSEEMIIVASNVTDLNKAKKAIEADGFEINTNTTSEATEEEEAEVEDMENQEEELEVKDMEVEDLKNLIRDIIAQEMGVETPEEELPTDELPADDMVGAEDEEEIDLDELLREINELTEEEVTEDSNTTREVVNADKTINKEKTSSELQEAIKTVNQLRTQLQEVNLLNAKLLYVNKVFKTNTLSESQKVNVIAAFDKAETVKEVQLVFETISNNVSKTDSRKNLRESRMGMASKATGLTGKKPEVINEVNETVLRMQKLAGIIK